jgi:hypothetical protein
VKQFAACYYEVKREFHSRKHHTKGEVIMFAMGFLGSILWYSVLFIFLVAVAVAGVFLGKTLRAKKDAKDAASAESDGNADIN